jgi:hypothetical protein
MSDTPVDQVFWQDYLACRPPQVQCRAGGSRNYCSYKEEAAHLGTGLFWAHISS